MVNAITQFLGIGSQRNAGQSNGASPQYFQLSGHKIPVNRIAGISIKKGCVNPDHAHEPTLKIALNQESTNDQTKAEHELVFAGDQANAALDALKECGHLDDIDILVKKQVFLNARFEYQDKLSNLSPHDLTD